MRETKDMCHAKCAAQHNVSIREDKHWDQFPKALRRGSAANVTILAFGFKSPDMHGGASCYKYNFHQLLSL